MRRSGLPVVLVVASIVFFLLTLVPDVSRGQTVNAGPDRVVNAGKAVHFFLAGVLGPGGGDITGTLVSSPWGSSASLVKEIGFFAFTPDVPGNYVVRFSLPRPDGSASSDDATVTCLPGEDGLERWEVRPAPSLSAHLRGVAYGNGAFASVGAGGTILYSLDDGFTWLRAESGISRDLNAVIFASGSFVAVGNGGAILTSSDGMAWSRRPSGVTADLRDVAYGNNRFVAVGGQAVAVSDDGVSWSGNFIDTGMGSGLLILLDSIAFGNGWFAAGGLGTDGSGDIGRLLKSQHGVTWTPATNTLEEYHTVGFGHGFFLLSSYIYTRHSSDLVNWLEPFLWEEGFYHFNRIAYENGVFFGFWAPDHFYTSRDGTTWTYRQNQANSTLKDAAFGREHYVVVGENGTILQSRSYSETAILTVNLSGSGTVTSSPSGIDCGDVCSAGFAAGSLVTLTGKAGSGFYFTGWGPPCSGNAPCTMALAGDTSLAAIFNPAGDPFLDVYPGHWAQGYIASIYAARITYGWGGTSEFKPDYEVNREQMAAFIVRARQGEPDGSSCGSQSPFSDVATSSWACPYIKRLSELGITTGYGGSDQYRPELPVTRAQMAAFIERAFLEGD